MKALVRLDELISHRRLFMIVKTPKRLAETAQVTISTSEQFSVIGPGFSHDMNCKAVKWGTVSLPYKVWKNIVENLVPILNDEEISIAAETFQIKFGGTKIEHPQIKVTRLDKLAVEIPVDAKPIEIVEFALQHDMRTLRGSGAWKTIRTSIDQVRKQTERACIPLKKYGVTPEDLADLAARKRDIADNRRFKDILFSRH